MLVPEEIRPTTAVGHPWWRAMRLGFVPGETAPVLDELVPGLLDHLARSGHAVLEPPDATTEVLLTTARFGQVVSWRKSLLLGGRRRFGLVRAPTVFTLVAITPEELAGILDHFESALAKNPPDPADFSFRGLTDRAHRVLIEQGRRGGPMMALVRLLQSQTFSIRVMLAVGAERLEAIYHMDLVGAHRRVVRDAPYALFEDIARRMATAASTGEVTEHEIVEPELPAEAWRMAKTPAAMEQASVEFGRRGFFTEMVRVGDLVDAPSLADAVASQYSEGCFATWDSDLNGLVATATGSARPVDKGHIAREEMSLIFGVRPDGRGARVRNVEGIPNLPPSSEAVEMMMIDEVLPRIPLGSNGNGAGPLPVVRSKLHGHRGVASFDPAVVEFVPLDRAYYEYPVSCGTEAQAQAITAAFGRAESLRNPRDQRTIAFTVLPGHGVVLCEKWVPGKVPFEVLWEAMDSGAIVIDRLVPQHRVDFEGRHRRMVLKSGVVD
ncbi:MAG TPA: hypothetical protein VLL77_11895 [Anaerolineales bacterium]|nr:hypothetical protein [Anaerolineales bacterium]